MVAAVARQRQQSKASKVSGSDCLEPRAGFQDRSSFNDAWICVRRWACHHAMPGDGMPGDGMPGDGMPGDGMPGDGMPIPT